MRAKEMRDRNDEEMKRMLADAKDQLFRMRLQNATHQLDNTSKLRTVRREIARIQTVIAERTRPASSEASREGNEE